MSSNDSNSNSVSTAAPDGKRIFFGQFDVTNQVFLTTPHSFALVNLKPLLPGHVLVCPLRPHRRLTDLAPAELTDLFSAVQRVQHMLARHYFFGHNHDDNKPGSKSNHPPATITSTTTTNPPPPPPQENQTQGPPGSFNIAIQDGPEAGQTVPHLHVHILPRIRGSTAKPATTPSDAIYDQMAGEEGNVGGALWDRELEREREDSVEGGRGGRPVPGGGFPRIEDADRMARGMEEMEAEARVYRGVLEEMGKGGE
ncbi:HIT-like domain-containing protein [Dichotomopilus funicola]|uniref:Bis(5'-adenosyl)-triphosphatase n=1 Tax=Dichotomopilus funicola TaxID=1934379 RepID=A0AAN6VB05_9PEZI|nr:HIT-like domain-containing protein [Dichotomopilus funicola]